MSSISSRSSSQIKRILNANAFSYRFFDDPEKNRNARAFLDSYKVVLRATKGHPDQADKLFQSAWNDRYADKGDKYNITIEDIIGALGDPNKAVSKERYFEDRARNSGPLVRFIYNGSKIVSQASARLLPSFMFTTKVNVSSDQENFKKKNIFKNLIEEYSDKKFRTPFKIFGHRRGRPVGSVLSVTGLVLSLAACTIIAILTFGSFLPVTVGIVATVLSVSGAALGVVGGEIMSHHDRNKKNRDVEKLLGDACDVAHRAKVENNPKLNDKANCLAKKLIGNAIDNSIELHKNGRRIRKIEWLGFGIKIAALCTVPVGDIIGGALGGVIKSSGALVSFGNNAINLSSRRYNHNNEVDQSSLAKRHIAYIINEVLNKELEKPLPTKTRDEPRGNYNDPNAMDYKTSKWSKEFKDFISKNGGMEEVFPTSKDGVINFILSKDPILYKPITENQLVHDVAMQKQKIPQPHLAELGRNRELQDSRILKDETSSIHL